MAKVLLLVVSVILCGVCGNITVNGPKCGQKVCKLDEYCSNLDRTCQDCANVCNKASHNYEEVICETQCQDYLHDLRYVKRSGDDNDEDDLRDTVAKLSRLITITLTLVIFLIVILGGLLIFQLYRWKVKKNITLDTIKGKIFKKSEQPNRNQETNNRRDLKLDMPSSTTINSEHSPVTVSTSIDRRPAEDSALDYAYDNPAMAKTPSRY